MKKLLIVLIAIVASVSTIFASENKDKILVIVSEANYIELKDGSRHPTGYYLSELMVPIDSFMKSGFEIDFATPTGKTPTMDTSSDNVQYFKNQEEHATLKKLHDGLKNLKHPLPLKNMNEKMFARYSGVFFPGGHAPMTDLYNNSDVGRALNYFHSTHKPTALICHAPIALLAAGSSNGKWIYSGYKMIGFSNEEEKVAESSFLKGQLKFYLEDELKNKGADFQNTKAWVGKSVWDRELITGQNPMSDRLLASDFIKALNGK